MVKVITYGTYDFLHYGHIRLLERAKALGDYLIVGVSSDNFVKVTGKINVQQSLEERVAAIMATGIPDKVIISEYDVQIIDDIKRYNIDIFTVGSDWKGAFDYLKEYCKVVYLPRTEGVSSSDIRAFGSGTRLGLVGNSTFLNEFYKESRYVNAIKTVGLCSGDELNLKSLTNEIGFFTHSFNDLLERVDAVYIHSHPNLHYEQCKEAILEKKHVLCESPIAITEAECCELIELAIENQCVLMEAIRTAYLTAYSRLVLLLKSGKIGRIVSVDATCTGLSTSENFDNNSLKWGALKTWGPTAMLPVFQLLGTDYETIDSLSIADEDDPRVDDFTKINLMYKQAAASIKVGLRVKSENDLIISGTKGFAYVPSPWWKTDYFEIKHGNSSDIKRYSYQIDGEGIRTELVQFAAAIKDGKSDYYIESRTTKNISKAIEQTLKQINRGDIASQGGTND